MAATTLPPINLGSKVGHPIHNNNNNGTDYPSDMMRPTPPSQNKPHSGTSSPQFLLVNKKRTHCKKDREMEERHEWLRAEMPNLTKIQTAAYRHTFKHNLCLDMLQKGFHKSFAELFALIRQQNAERKKAGPDTATWNAAQLENEHEKMNMIKQLLTTAETAQQRGDITEVYKCQLSLARYFQKSGDKWLSDHFYQQCLTTSSKVEGKYGARYAAQSHCYVALAVEENGDYNLAAKHFERYYALTTAQDDWLTDSGTMLHVDACIHMSRIYTIQAEREKNRDHMEQSLALLVKAYAMAREGGDKQSEGEASLRLGKAYQTNGRPDQALTFLTKYLHICEVQCNTAGIGKACEAIAKSYLSQGKIEESIKYLEMCVEVAENSKDDKSLSRACSDLGAIFNALGRYEQAVSYFNKAYNISRALNDTETISKSRVQFGVAAAHRMLGSYVVHLAIASGPAMERLAEWKDNRGDDFEKPLEEEDLPADYLAIRAIREEEEDAPEPEPTMIQWNRPDDEMDKVLSMLNVDAGGLDADAGSDADGGSDDDGGSYDDGSSDDDGGFQSTDCD